MKINVTNVTSYTYHFFFKNGRTFNMVGYKTWDK